MRRHSVRSWTCLVEEVVYLPFPDVIWKVAHVYHRPAPVEHPGRLSPQYPRLQSAGPTGGPMRRCCPRLLRVEEGN